MLEEMLEFYQLGPWETSLRQSLYSFSWSLTFNISIGNLKSRSFVGPVLEVDHF